MESLKSQVVKDIVENINQIENIEILKSILTLTFVIKSKGKAE